MIVVTVDQGDHYQQKRYLLLIICLPICLCLITLIHAAVRNNLTSQPPFKVLMCADSPAAKGMVPQIRTYRIVRIIPGRQHCIAITTDGSHLTVIGSAMTSMKPGFVFQARIEVVPPPDRHPDHRTLWLIEPIP